MPELIHTGPGTIKAGWDHTQAWSELVHDDGTVSRWVTPIVSGGTDPHELTRRMYGQALQAWHAQPAQLAPGAVLQALQDGSDDVARLIYKLWLRGEQLEKQEL